jgi:hypothetical protein
VIFTSGLRRMLLSVQEHIAMRKLLTLKNQTVNQRILNQTVLMLKSFNLLRSVEENPV